MNIRLFARTLLAALGLAVSPGLLLAADDGAPAPVQPEAKPAGMQPAPKLDIKTNQDEKRKEFATAPVDPLPPGIKPMGINEFRMKLLQQEMQYHPEIRQKVELVIEMLKNQQAKHDQHVEMREERIAEEQRRQGWLFDNLRETYISQGLEIPDSLKTPQEFVLEKKENQDIMNAWQKASSPEEFMQLWQEQKVKDRQREEASALFEDGQAKSLDPLEDVLTDPNESLTLSLSERLQRSRDRFSESREEYQKQQEEEAANALEQAAQDPEAGNEALTWKPDSEEEEANTLAYIETESAKTTFGPGELQWFENQDDTLPIAGPDTAEGAAMRQGLLPGEFEMYWQNLEELNEDLLAAEANEFDPGSRPLSETMRPNIDVPMETFIKKATVVKEEVRKAEQIQESIKQEKEQRSRMLRPSMDRYGIRAFPQPHNLLAPNARRTFEDRYNEENPPR